MKNRISKLISFALILLLPVLAFSQDCEKVKIQGENAAATQHSSAGWFLGGVGSGVLLGLIGTGIITGASALSNPQPKLIPENVDQQCYINGYSKKGKSKNIWGAFGGGLVGTAAFVTVILIADAQ